MAQIDATLVLKLFDNPRRGRKTNVPHHRAADALKRRLEIPGQIMHRKLRHRAQVAFNLTLPKQISFSFCESHTLCPLQGCAAGIPLLRSSGWAASRRA